MMDTADPTVIKSGQRNHKGTGQVASKEVTFGRRPEKQNADSLQVQEASSQLIGGHGQEAH
jgi:hypothetical protein